MTATLNKAQQEFLAEAVDRGAEYMDTFHPGWETLVNLETLEMQVSNSCILGQGTNLGYATVCELYEDEEFNSLGPDGSSLEMTYVHFPWEEWHGFMSPFRVMRSDGYMTSQPIWDALNRLWAEKVEKRMANR